MLLIVLGVTHAAHRAVGASATAGGFSLFLVADHFQDDRETEEKYAESDENGGEVLSDPIEYDHRGHSFLLVLIN